MQGTRTNPFVIDSDSDTDSDGEVFFPVGRRRRCRTVESDSDSEDGEVISPVSRRRCKVVDSTDSDDEIICPANRRYSKTVVESDSSDVEKDYYPSPKRLKNIIWAEDRSDTSDSEDEIPQLFCYGCDVVHPIDQFSLEEQKEGSEGLCLKHFYQEGYTPNQLESKVVVATTSIIEEKVVSDLYFDYEIEEDLGNFKALPPRLLCIIASYLSKKDRTELALSCKYYSSVLSNAGPINFIPIEVLRLIGSFLSLEDHINLCCCSRYFLAAFKFTHTDLFRYCSKEEKCMDHLANLMRKNGYSTDGDMKTIEGFLSNVSYVRPERLGKFVLMAFEKETVKALLEETTKKKIYNAFGEYIKRSSKMNKETLIRVMVGSSNWTLSEVKNQLRFLRKRKYTLYLTNVNEKPQHTMIPLESPMDSWNQGASAFRRQR